MKLIFAIIRDNDVDSITQALNGADFRVTRVASTGGLLRRGVTTLLIGVEDSRVDAAIQTIREACSPAEEGEKKATIFVTNVDHYLQI